MARVLHWGVLMGGLVVIADLATMAVSRSMSSPDTGGLDAFNLLLNAVFFSIAGASAYRDTGSVRLGLLAGLLAGVLDGIVVGAAEAIARPAEIPAGATADQILLEAVAWNAFLGILLAAASAGISALARRTRG